MPLTTKTTTTTSQTATLTPSAAQTNQALPQTNEKSSMSPILVGILGLLAAIGLAGGTRKHD